MTRKASIFGMFLGLLMAICLVMPMTDVIAAEDFYETDTLIIKYEYGVVGIYDKFNNKSSRKEVGYNAQFERLTNRLLVICNWGNVYIYDVWNGGKWIEKEVGYDAQFKRLTDRLIVIYKWGDVYIYDVWNGGKWIEKEVGYNAQFKRVTDRVVVICNLGNMYIYDVRNGGEWTDM